MMVYPTMRHETLNETERDSAMRNFAGWCLTVVGRRT
jgi:alpha-beta hydrolase superfamily lysophospholipase